MIFVTLGSQKFQFDRLLKQIDSILLENKIQDKVYAQIGYSTYTPQKYEYKKFLNREEFTDLMKVTDLVITHGGTGAIVNALKNGKKVIAVPRLAKFQEHVDDHQLQIIDQFEKSNLIYSCFDVKELADKIERIKTHEFNDFYSNTEIYISEIDKFLCDF